MATAPKIVKIKPAIEPEVKEFIDEVLVPMLVRDALSDFAAEKALASSARTVANSASTALRGAEEIR